MDLKDQDWAALENECQWSRAEGGTAGHGTDQTEKTVTKVSEGAQLGLKH